VYPPSCCLNLIVSAKAEDWNDDDELAATHIKVHPTARGFDVKKQNNESFLVRGYVTKRGTYVMPHRQTNPNSTRMDNWSAKGNVNPHTGRRGTKAPY
jgi:hypothetical protein